MHWHGLHWHAQRCYLLMGEAFTLEAICAPWVHMCIVNLGMVTCGRHLFGWLEILFVYSRFARAFQTSSTCVLYDTVENEWVLP